MSNNDFSVQIEYFDTRNRIKNRRERKNAQLQLRKLETHSEIRIKSQKGIDSFIVKQTSILSERSKDDDLCIWLPDYRCILHIKSSTELIKSVSMFFGGGKENSSSNIDVGTPKKQYDTNEVDESTSPEIIPVQSKRRFGIMKDLFGSGYTPEGKMSMPPTRPERRSPQDKSSKTVKQSIFMGMMTQAAKFDSTRACTASMSKVAARTEQQGVSPKSTIPSTERLTAEQEKVVEACLQGQNVFYTGGAGTGKSTLLKVLIDKLQKKHGGSQDVYVAATTGLAACAVGGTTLHQFAGISGLLEESEDIRAMKAQHHRVLTQTCSKSFVLRRWRTAKVLLVDEVSMLSPTLLEILNSIGQRARGNSMPLGGLQVVFSGDFYQLPPVVSQKLPVTHSTATSSQSFSTRSGGSNDPTTHSCPTLGPTQGLTQDQTQSGHLNSMNSNKAMTANSHARTDHARRFCFQSPIWHKLFSPSHCYDLQVVFRQAGDEGFIGVLNAIRSGSFTTISKEMLQGCVRRSLDSSDGILPTQIFTHKRDVDRLNSSKLAALPGSVCAFTATDSGEDSYLRVLQAHCPARQQLELKVGAQVILVKTTAALDGLVNGARGTVTKFVSNYPIVKFADGEERSISPEVFTLALGGRVVAQRSQLPLDLAWGISVHKSQGMTVDKAELHLKNVFEYGQVYVALSRVRTIEGLSLSHAIQQDHVMAHPEVNKFYQALKKSNL